MGIWKEIKIEIHGLKLDLKVVQASIVRLEKLHSKPIQDSPTSECELLRKIMVLPKYLQDTILAPTHLNKQSTSNEVALMTHKHRAVESGYLNQLCRLKLVNRRMVGDRAMFDVVKE